MNMYRSHYNKIINVNLLFAVVVASFSGILLLIDIRYGIVLMGFALCIILIRVINSVEYIFLFWLLLTPIFSTDDFSFVIISGHPILTFDRVVIGLLFIYLLIQFLSKTRKLYPINMFDITLLIYFSVVLYSIFSKSHDRISNLRVFVDVYLIPFFIYILSKNLLSNKTFFQKYLQAIVIVALYLALLGIYEHFTLHDLFPGLEGLVSREGWLRVNGPFKHDSSYGVFMSICFFVVFFNYITSPSDSKTKKYYSVLCLFISMLVLISIFYNNYRGIWIAATSGILVWIVLRKKNLGKIAYVLAIAGVLSVVNIDSITSSRLYRERIIHVPSIQSRLNTYEHALREYKRNPITGIGFGNFDDWHHNMFLAFLSEMGLLGFLAALANIMVLFFLSRKFLINSNNDFSKEYSMIFIAILVVYFVPWMSLNAGYDSNVNKLFYLIIGTAFNSQHLN
jgi:O-antigen ligase